MTSVAGNSKTVEKTSDAIAKARRIEDSISSVIRNMVVAPAAGALSSNEFARGIPAAGFTIAPLGTTSAGALTNEFSSSVISKHKSLASSLPSLTGVVVNSSLSSLSSPSSVTASLNICRGSASTTTTTTTSTRSSRHLQLVGDLPENVLETSCTPPSSPSKLASGHHQQSSTAAPPVFASLTPVSVGGDSGNAISIDSTTTSVLGLMSPTAVEDPSHRLTTVSSSSTMGATFAANNTAAALTQLFPMVTTASAASAVSPYLAVKVEPLEIGFSSASPSCGDNSMVTCSAPILSPLQFSLTSGGTVTSPALTTLAAVTGTNASAPIFGSSSSAASNSEFLSLQPAAVYVQPIQQNGQVQYVRLELPSAISLPSSGSAGPSNGNGKAPSTVSTVQLAHSIIATMFQQQTTSSAGDGQQLFESGGSLQPSIADSAQENDEEKGTSISMAPTFVLTEQSDSKANVPMAAFKITAEPRTVNASSHVQQRYVPAGITVTTKAAVGPQPQTLASRKRASSSSASQSRQRQQSMSLSKDAPSSTGNAGSASGEDESDDIYIDTKELCNRIAYELKAHSIPQAVFAERVLCRSQGTLSDLLRNPKPWNKLKSGRETFRRMYVWLKQPLVERLASLELWKGGKRKSSTSDDPDQGGLSGEAAPVAEASGGETPEEVSSEDVCYSSGCALVSPRPDDPVASTSNEQPVPAGAVNEQVSPQRHQQRVIKKPRLVFTDIQKRTLQAIFKETQRPSREMQQTIAEHLNLDLSTVQNFFMNARRRSRIEQPDGNGDSPTPFQQVRPITPPPAATASSPLGATVADPDSTRPRPSQSLTPGSDFGKARPKRPNRRPAKPKQTRSADAHPTFESATAMANDQPMNRLSFSGTSSPPAPGLLNLPTLALRNDGGSINGGDDIDALMLEGENENGDAEYTEEDDEGSQSHDAAIATILEYKTSPSAGGAVGQGESTISATVEDVKPGSL